MKSLVFVCLALLTFVSKPVAIYPSSFSPKQGAFSLAQRIGEPNARSFFRFSTSAGNYTIRHDGLGEVSLSKGLRRVFNLKLGMNGRLSQLYFLEHENDLLLLYEIAGQGSGWGYLLRMDQTKRKPRWLTPVQSTNLGPCLVDAGAAYFSAANLLAKIELQSGKYLWQNAEIDERYPPMFEQFLLPIIKGDLVIFREEQEQGRAIQVNKTDGTVAAVVKGS